MPVNLRSAPQLTARAFPARSNPVGADVDVVTLPRVPGVLDGVVAGHGQSVVADARFQLRVGRTEAEIALCDQFFADSSLFIPCWLLGNHYTDESN